MNIDPAAFARMREAYEEADEKREYTIKRSRDILKASKHAIYLVHEQKHAQAQEALECVEQARKDIREHGDPRQGSLRNALEEYVEARALLAFMQDDDLPTDEDLDVDTEPYIAGLCDTTGELLRIATRAATRNDEREIARARDLIDELHGQLLQFHFRNGHLRNKSESVKHNLKKIEHLEYETGLRRE